MQLTEPITQINIQNQEILVLDAKWCNDYQ